MTNDVSVNIGPAKADCSSCEYKNDLLQKKLCQPGDACIKVKSGRQIDRFMRNNPGLANHYLDDNFWETRAIAVRYASQQQLLKLIDDRDEVVRRAVAYRIPADELYAMIDDEDREVRITVADRISPQHLEQMADDDDYLVRVYVSRRLPKGRLFRMMCDVDPQVRKEVARRIPEASLVMLAEDKEADIRRIVAERMNSKDVAIMLGDSEWLVRLTAAEHVDISVLKSQTIKDDDPEVRAVINRRLNEEK